MRLFRHPRWQHLDYRLKVATTQENKPPTQGTRQWTFTTPRWRCGSILLPSLNAGVPEPTGGWRHLRNIQFDTLHWDQVTHICVIWRTIISSDNGLSPGRHQAIIWTNAGILLIGPIGTNFNEILIEIHTFSFKEIHFKMSSGKWRPSCLGLNVLMVFLWRAWRHRQQQLHRPQQVYEHQHQREIVRTASNSMADISTNKRCNLLTFRLILNYILL